MAARRDALEALAVRLVDTYGVLPELHRAQEMACELAADIARCRRGGGCVEKYIVGSVARMNLAMAVLQVIVDPKAVSCHEREACAELQDEIEITELTRASHREGAA